MFDTQYFGCVLTISCNSYKAPAVDVLVYGYFRNKTFAAHFRYISSVPQIIHIVSLQNLQGS